MKRKENYPLQKVTLNLRKGDWDYLRTVHGRLGASKVIREIVIGHCERAKESAAQRAKDIQVPMEGILEDMKGTE